MIEPSIFLLTLKWKFTLFALIAVVCELQEMLDFEAYYKVPTITE